MRTSKTKKADKRASRADVERLLSAEAAADGERFGGLSSIVEALGGVGEPPSEDEVSRFAAQAAKVVPLGPDRPKTRARAASAVPVRRRRLMVRLAGTLAAVVVVLAGFSGFAYTANGAIPGDALYGVDLALEKVGIGAGGVGERLTEASRLVEKGRAQEGLDLASDAMAQSADGDVGLRAAAAALRAAAEAALRNQGLQTRDELDETAARLRQMAGEKTNADLTKAAEDLAGSLDSQGGTGGDEPGGSGQGGSVSPTTTTEPGSGGAQQPGGTGGGSAGPGTTGTSGTGGGQAK